VQDEDRDGDAGRRAQPESGAARRDQHRRGDLVHVRARLGAGRGRRRPLCPQLPVDRPADGRRPGPQGLRRGGARGRRQHPGGRPGGHDPRHGGDLRRRLEMVHVQGRDRLHHPDRDPPVPPRRPAGPHHLREGLTPMPKHIIALAAAVLLSFGLSHYSDRIDPYFLDVLTGVGINIILAVSLNLVNGYTGQFSLGHAGFMSVGAYLSAGITLLLGPRLFGSGGGSALQQGMLFLAALVAGGLGAAVAGLAGGIPPLRLKGDYLALVTLGFGEIIRVTFQNVDALGGALGLNGIPNYTTVFWVYSFAALAVFTVICLVRSTYGRGFIATRDDEVASEAIGLNTTRYKIVAFVVGAFFAGVAGGLYGHFKLTI